MDLTVVIYILLGSTFGLIFRLFVKDYFRKKIIFLHNYTSIVNILSSLFLGILVSSYPINKNLFFFFYVGFLGCFSTFSSFIYELFNLIQKRQYLKLFLYYIQIIFLSFLFFCVGYFIILPFKIWIKKTLSLYYY